MTPQLLDINNIILPAGPLAMEPKYGVKLYSQYLMELMQISCGVSASEMGYGERRKASMVQTIEVPSSNGTSKMNKIAIVNISGMIRGEDGMSSYGMGTISEMLLREKNNVSGAIFKINSGGGYMDGAEMMIAAIREFGKPTVTLTHFAGSAAYMIASETQQILTQTEMSEVGSIGTLIELSKDFREQYKEKVDVIYADSSVDKNDAFRKWLNGDISGFVETVNAANKHFIKLVKNNRELKGEDETIQKTLSGGMFYSKDAKERGLVDGQGDNQRAISLIQKLNK